jgi:hypothetical protein
MNPHSRLEVNASLFAVDSNIVDGLQIRHPVEEDVALWGGSPVGNRAQALGKSELLGSGFGSGVGVTELLGRKMVLKPFPTKSPANAASGPSGAGGGGVWATLWSGWTSLKKKSPGSLMVPLEPVSLIRNPPLGANPYSELHKRFSIYTTHSSRATAIRPRLSMNIL